MINYAFAVFDVKSDTYGVPWFAVSRGVALRSFADLANDRNTTVGRHPEDFKLCVVGAFDDSSGTLSGIEPVESLGFAADYVKREESGHVGPRRVS